jgi:predicted acyl esterase
MQGSARSGIIGLLGVILGANAALAATAPCPPRAESVSFLTEDGVTLRGEVLSPCGAEASDELPAVLFLNPFGQSYATYKSQASALASDGYRSFLYNPRGWHSSDGTTTLDYALLTRDAQKALDWLTSAYATGRIGATGISEGGGLSLLLAAADSRLSAVGVLSGWTDLTHSSLGATTRVSWSLILGTLVLAFGDPGAMLEDAIRKARQQPPIDPEAMKRAISPWYHLAALNEKQVPIFLSHALDDTLFPANQVVDFYHQLTGPKHLEINRGCHACIEIVNASNPEALPWSSLRAWFDDYLKGGRQSEAEGSIRIAYKNRDLDLTLQDFAWREPRVETQYLVHSPEGYQLTQTPTASTGRGPRVVQLAQDVSGIGTGTPMLSPLLNLRWLKTVKVPVTNIRRPFALSFVGAPRIEPTTIYGSPKLTLTLQSRAGRGMIVAHLVDLKDGQTSGELITHGVYTWTEKDRRPTGEISFQIELYSVAWQLEAGHRLAVVLNGSDVEYLAPRVLPYSYRLTPAAGAQVLTLPTVSEAELRSGAVAGFQ